MEKHVAEALASGFLATSHRSSSYEGIHRKAVRTVRQLMGVPEDREVFFFSSATEIWERMLQNTVQGKSWHFVNGAFSERFYHIAKELDLDCAGSSCGVGSGF